MNEKNYTCIVCPMSCSITVREENGQLIVTGNSCPRGEKFAKDEYVEPKRMLTTTIEIEDGVIRRLPVISSAELPKEKISAYLKEIYQVKVKAPVTMGDVIIADLCASGIDIVAARDVEAKK